MEEKDLKNYIKMEIEAEADVWEKKAEGNSQLDSLEIPELSFEDVKKRAETSSGLKEKPFHIRKGILLAAALVAILTLAAGVGAAGARLFVPSVENRGDDGELRIAVDSDSQDVLYLKDITEDEAYEEIEKRLGILALRLESKPKGMELGKVYIDEDSGEALMEFQYGEKILTVYAYKQRDSASMGSQPDGIEIDTVEIFHLGQNIGITEIDKGDGTVFYRTQMEYANTYYCLRSDIDLEEFKNILFGILFKTV